MDMMDRKIPRAAFSEVFEPHSSRPSSHEALKVDLERGCVNRLPLLEAIQGQA
jgi:hypothetical protein